LDRRVTVARPAVRPVSFSSGVGRPKRHLRPASCPARQANHGTVLVVYGRQAEDTVNRPRSDEVTGFTRCSVLKVRADARLPAQVYVLAQGAAPKERLAAPPEASTGASRSNTRSRADQSVRPANRAKRRRPTCQTEPAIGPGGSPSIGRSSAGCGCPFIRTPPCARSRLASERLLTSPMASRSAGTWTIHEPSCSSRK